MRRPYDTILSVSLILTIIFFALFDKPNNPNTFDDLHDIGIFGLLYVILFFGLISFARLYFRKRS